jgi:hypothetical protein
MKCLRIYADPDGESHFADLEIPLSTVEFFPGVPLRVSARYKASSVQFLNVPAELRDAGWHKPPQPYLVIWLTGQTEFEASDGDIRHVGPGSAVLAEDTWGKGHVSRHPEEAQQVIVVALTDSLSAEPAPNAA